MKTVVITGASSGIGFAVAGKFAGKGYRIIGVGHCHINAEKARNQLMDAYPNAEIVYFSGELMQQREVLRVADEIGRYLEERCGGALEVLINNVGGVRSLYTTTEEGYEQQFALNHLAAFLLTYRLLPYLQKAQGRILMTGSNSHKGIKIHWEDPMLRKGYNPLTAYKQSKLCSILFARGLNDRYAEKSLRAYAVDPGLVNTDIGNKQTGSLVNFIWTLRKRHGVLPEIPAQTYLFLSDQPQAPEGLYYYLCRKRPFSKQVTKENADRLFELSEQLCGITYGRSEAAG